MQSFDELEAGVRKFYNWHQEVMVTGSSEALDAVRSRLSREFVLIDASGDIHTFDEMVDEYDASAGVVPDLRVTVRDLVLVAQCEHASTLRFLTRHERSRGRGFTTMVTAVLGDSGWLMMQETRIPASSPLWGRARSTPAPTGTTACIA